MLVTWQTESLAKEQLQMTAFSLPFTWTDDVQLFCLLHGSTLKSQSSFPSVLAMSCRACTIIQKTSHMFNYLHGNIYRHTNTDFMKNQKINIRLQQYIYSHLWECFSQCFIRCSCAYIFIYTFIFWQSGSKS